jgi:hypothetical protein
LRLIESGKTEEQIAEIVGVSKSTINNWKGKHPEFLYAIRESRQVADELVEAALFNRAMGYSVSYPETKVFCTKSGEIITETITKHVSHPPDTTAAMFWLRNRQPGNWKEKTEGDVTVNNTIHVANLTDEQLDEKLKALLAKEVKP